MTKSEYNPDILSCLANLSNDEVFTPPEVANAMLDLLPQEIFSDPDATFLDPACKSGVFLREIAKRLIEGLADEIPDLEERIDHIFKKQIFGIAITELTSLLSRRSVYCSKGASGDYSVARFSRHEGNIFYELTAHKWEGGKCVYCGASEAEYSEEKRAGLESHAYQFIHNAIPGEIENMKFDVIIGNPPYQMSDGGEGGSAMPLYNKFIEQAKKLSPRFLVMIIPARWFAGGRGLEIFRNNMLHDKRIRKLVDYPISSECFSGVEIKGGICYFLWTRDTEGTCSVTTIRNSIHNTMERYLLEDSSDTFIRYNESIDIFHKVLNLKEKSFSGLVSSLKPFGLRTYVTGNKEKKSSSITLFANRNVGYIEPSEILINKDWINRYKVFISRAYGAGEDFPHQILGVPIFGDKNTCCTETYLVIGPFEEKKETENVISYIKTNFFRFMVLLHKNTQDAPKSVYQFVPMQDFTSASDIDWSRSVPQIDEQLYAKYGLSSEEVAFIESMIRPME